MSQEIEIEYKMLLTEQEHTRLLVALPFPEVPCKQTNYYFETKTLELKDLGCALRIREKNDKYQLTLKEPHPDGLLETHDSLSKKEACSWINGNINDDKYTMKRLIGKNINIAQLICYGSLVTERRQFQNNDILYVLDYSTYNGYADWELEIEAPSKESGLEAFHSLLQKYAITEKETPNKISRFFQTHCPADGK
ncbi:CYTH domain-containing protein [Virgibacillus sp. W0181]|uniref:CYTH domain-containing protein n=1 Tax=Virgibacillus sp. W0181 TaxID=3391581 RepID=UPI003F4643E1